MRKVKSAGTGKEPGLGQGTGHLGTSRAGKGQGPTGSRRDGSRKLKMLQFSNRSL